MHLKIPSYFKSWWEIMIFWMKFLFILFLCTAIYRICRTFQQQNFFWRKSADWWCCLLMTKKFFLHEYFILYFFFLTTTQFPNSWFSLSRLHSKVRTKLLHDVGRDIQNVTFSLGIVRMVFLVLIFQGVFSCMALGCLHSMPFFFWSAVVYPTRA